MCQIQANFYLILPIIQKSPQNAGFLLETDKVSWWESVLDLLQLCKDSRLVPHLAPPFWLTGCFLTIYAYVNILEAFDSILFINMDATFTAFISISLSKVAPLIPIQISEFLLSAFSSFDFPLELCFILTLVSFTSFWHSHITDCLPFRNSFWSSRSKLVFCNKQRN